MAILVECPACKKQNSAKAKSCSCGFALAKFSGKCYWISFYGEDRRLKRERIGPNKAAAEQRLREVLSNRAEGRHIRKSPDARTTFKELATWYLALPEVQAKRSYIKDQQHCTKLIAEFSPKLIKDIHPQQIEAYKQKRLAAMSYRGRPIKPSTVNRELTTLKTIFNKAVRNGKAERNPAQSVRPFKENNARDRILSPEEYARLLAHCPDHVRPVVKVAYHTGMRRGEILSLR